MLSAFIIYASVLLLIVYFSYKKNTSEADFVLGGRKMNFWVTAISAHASDMSSWLFLAFPATIFIKGMLGVWIAIGLVVGMFLNWHFIAPKLRVETEKHNSLTLSTFFEKKFHDYSGFIRITTAIICIFFFMIYVSSGLVGMGEVFEHSFGISYKIGLLFGVAVAILYTIFGGFITVAWTDFFQGIFLVVMIFLVPLVALSNLGGLTSIRAGALHYNVSLKLFPNLDFKGWVAVILTMLSMGPGYFGQPHIITKFMGIKNPKDIYKSKYFGITWQILAFLGATLVGLSALAFFKAAPSNPELIFTEMTKVLFHPFIAGLILCAILAATISTIETQILIQATLISEDFYKKFFRPNAKSIELLWISRLFVFIVAVVAFFIAYLNVSSIYKLVLYAWSGLGASFGPIVILSLYSKKINKHGAVAAILVGAISSSLWHYINPLFKLQIPELIPAFILSFISAYIFSYLAKHRTSS